MNINYPVLIAALSILGAALVAVALYYYFTRKKRAIKKASREAKANNDLQAIKSVAKNYLRETSKSATQLTSTKLLAVPGKLPKGVSAFYLYFSYRDLTRNEAKEELIRVDIKRTKRRGEKKIEETIKTSTVAAALKPELITKIKKL